jgi:uncharacterized protein
MAQNKKNKNIVKWTLGTYFALITVWILAWILKTNSNFGNEWLERDQGSFVYWTVAKTIIWIIPALWLLKLSGRSLQQVYNLHNWKEWLVWGGSIGFIIGLTGIIPKVLANQQIFPLEPTYALVNVVTIAPIFEEFLIRGAILGNLQQRYTFWKANVLSSVLFVGLHLPGWYFMGILSENLTKPVGGAFSIFLLGLAFGYATYRGKSVMGGTLAHFLNNLFSLR